MNAKQSFENILLVLLIVSSFLPGPPNRLVVGLSALAQSAAFFGVVLAPEGAALVAYGFPGSYERGRNAPTCAGIAASSLVGLFCHYVWKGVRKLEARSSPFVKGAYASFATNREDRRYYWCD
ncbi:hypothetical protein [Dyadobacter endophyticus]|uniref:hypothetical protein n=1 Tax=Dyadobacter endophyticus TaxID=1749036 RepID=UPI00166CDEE9|nr:hypothetical protein [Dyadobacter endophyticus]